MPAGLQSDFKCVTCLHGGGEPPRRLERERLREPLAQPLGKPLETAAKAKNEEGVATASRAVNGTCMGCHTAHRERLPDGTSEIK